MTQLSLKEDFDNSAAEVDAIFDNFRTLHDIYTKSFEQLELALNDLPHTYKNKVTNAKATFKNMSATVSKEQRNISGQLYAQAIVLLMGNAESILESAFRLLIIDNFRKIKLDDSKITNFTLSEILNAKHDEDYGALLLAKLEANKNPNEKLSFQNMQQLEKIFQQNLGIVIPANLIVGLHEFWQIRHVVIHRQGVIDQQFIDNLKAADIDTKRYRPYQKLALTNADYTKCFSMLVLMFEKIDEEIARLGLKYELPF